LIDAYGI